MKKILFIEGYDSIGYNEQSRINIQNLLDDYKVQFFSYKNSEDVFDIIKRLRKLLKFECFHAIIAHSTAGSLLKVVTNLIPISYKTKIIITNGFITDKHKLNYKIFNLMPRAINKIILFPRYIRVPLNQLTYGIDKYIKNIIDPKQYVIDNALIIGDVAKLTTKYNFDKDTLYHVIYGIDDQLIPYNNSLVRKLNKYNNIRLYPLKSKNEPFNDKQSIQLAWRKIILDIVG